MHINKITSTILRAAFEVHTQLGPGLLESAYESCLAYELTQMGLLAETQKPLPLDYKEVRMECGFRVDLFVEREVIIEIKSVEHVHEIHLAQVLTYMKLMNKEIGLILNFNVRKMKDGIKRVILTPENH
jgi:GxxExxY protein